jgi:hypothetical protein
MVSLGVVLLLLSFVGPAWSQEPAAAGTAAPAAAAPAAAAFSETDLEQIVAPIALYPDSLMLQIMMAATYPLEVVQASRWLSANPDLTGDKLDEGLKGQDWDPSVKSICNFREVVKRLNDNLDWTKDLGDAFLAQENDVMAAVQRMRAKANEAGTLKTTEQQTVIIKEKVIIIEPAKPEVVYVPTYYPTVVYGSAWVYPWAYPAVYAPPPPGYGAMTFAAGVVAGAALYSACDWHNDYHHGGSYNNNVKINVDVHDNYVNKTNNVNNAGKYKKSGTGSSNWNHDPSHRGGVNYRSPQTAQKYGGRGQAGAVPRDTARGRDRAGSTGAAGGRGTAAGAGSGAGARPSAQPSAGGTRDASRSGASRDSAMSGSRASSMDSASRSRGQASRSGSSGGGRSSSGRSGGGGRR